MTDKKSTKTNKPAAVQAPAQETDTTAPDQDKATPTVEDTAAVDTPAPEPAASPAHQPAVEPPAPAGNGDSDHPEAGEDPGPNMTSHDYDALHGLTPIVDGGNASGEQSPLALLTAERLGLTPLQHITAIIAGGVVGGMLARTKSYEPLDLRKAAETIGMCAQLAEMILHIDDPMPEAPDNAEGI